MKKILLIAAVAGIAMASCKKDYVCECTETSTVPGSTTETSKYTIVGVSKGRAKANCASTKSEMEFGGNKYEFKSDCKIK